MDENKRHPDENDGEFTADLITLTDEDGIDHEFELVDTLEHGGSTYVALLTSPEKPEDVLEEDGNLVIMKIVSEGEEEILEIIEDDDEFEEISQIFTDRLGDLFEFETGDDE